MKKVLVTGGAGYIGSVLVRLLLNKGYFVRVLDKLNFGGESLIECFNNSNFEFVKGDVRNIKDVKKAMNNIDYVVHLAAIVGDPACAKEPNLAKEVNVEGSKLLYKIANENSVKKFVFASTCSNYGKMKDSSAYVDENSELRPVSLYAETKVEIENYLLNKNKNSITKPTCLRFSTVYGISPRMRFDLTVNEFTKELALGREFIIFGEQFWRPYCHVIDLARSAILVIESDSRTDFNIYNVGDTKENYTKKMLINEIEKFISDVKIKYVKKEEDARDYRVSFEKIKKELGFNITKRVPDGIKQIVQLVNNGILENFDDKKYKNV
jgi:nucleoside-diphosphate-sugar epimerase